jgi:hypothetical protein
MQIIVQSNRFVFFGTARELRAYLRTLPTHMTLNDFIRSRLH